MADLTPHMSAKDYLLMVSGKSKSKSLKNASPYASAFAGSAWTGSVTELSVAAPARKNKYNAIRTRIGDEVFDSRKEAKTFQDFTYAKQAKDPSERVVSLERSRKYLLVAPQDRERAVRYIADFVVEYADGRIEVIDTKSDITRKNPLYVVKRKLMLERHNIRIKEM